MGMPSTKAECDREIANKKAEIARIQAGIHLGDKGMKKTQIAGLKGYIARLQAHKKTLK